MGLEYDAIKWKLFIDSFSRSLKAVFLHNGNSFSSLPMGYSVEMKKTQNSMDHSPSCVNYHEPKWLIFGDLKVVVLSEAELFAWQSLKLVVTNFQGNHWSVEYEKEMEELLKSSCLFRAWLSVKLHFLRPHLDYFSKNCEDFSKTFALWKSPIKASGM